jgi:hypothetical protein
MQLEQPNNSGESMSELRARLAQAEARVEELEATLRRVQGNAESWHGPPPIQSESGPHQGHASALAVIAEWCRTALATQAQTEDSAELKIGESG